MKRFWWATGAAFVVFVLVDLVLGVEPPGLVAAFSFAGCALIIVGSKWLGKRFIQRPEDHYGAQATLPEDRLSGAVPEDRDAHGG